MEIAFCSGHVNLTSQEFEQHYQPDLEDAIIKGHHFVVGSSPGADTMALDFLINRLMGSSRINVYLFERSPKRDKECRERYASLGIPFQFGFNSYTSRDAQMTKDSTYDIAWVRPLAESQKLLGSDFDPKKISGTQRNLDRRQKACKDENSR